MKLAVLYIVVRRNFVLVVESRKGQAQDLMRALPLY
jgi:hypothetical protein